MSHFDVLYFRKTKKNEKSQHLLSTNPERHIIAKQMIFIFLFTNKLLVNMNNIIINSMNS